MDAEIKEARWRKKRVGRFSASSISNLMSASGKYTKGNLSYLYKIQIERAMGHSFPNIHSRSMNIGTENEPIAVEWLRKFHPEWNIQHCSEDYDDIYYQTTDYGLGVSCDTFMTGKDKFDIRGIVEIKCVTGIDEICAFFSETIPYKKKRARAFELHKHQLACQLLANENLEQISLLKYLPQFDDVMEDTDSPLDARRGILFTYAKEEFGTLLSDIKDRVTFCNNYLNSGMDLEKINDERI